MQVQNKNKASVVSFRVSLHIKDALNVLARRKGQTLAEYVAEMVLNQIEK